MSPVSAKTFAPSASQVFTYTKGAALTSALRALPRWRTLWSVEVRTTTQTCTASLKNVSHLPLTLYKLFNKFSVELLIG